MDEEEAIEYFKNIALDVRMLKHYIDYENIDRPIQTIDDYAESYPINIGLSEYHLMQMQTHTFTDNVSRLQLFGGET